MFSLSGKQRVDINAISFAEPDWAIAKNEASVIQWINPDGNITVSVHFFDTPPDIPTIRDVEVLRKFYRAAVSQINGGILEVDISRAGGLPLVRTLFKMPQKPMGITYIASLTVPFKTCSFVLKVQTVETGLTGLREAIVVDKLMAASLGPNYDHIDRSWARDPYDSNFKEGTLMNKSEQPLYDLAFPHHPLTMARQWLAQLQCDLTWKEEIPRPAPFDK